MDKVLITGGAGFIGFHVASALLRAGSSVAVLDNYNDYYEVSLKQDRAKRLEEIASEPGAGKLMLVTGDIADEQILSEVFLSFAPDTVIHLAAQAGVRYSIDHPDTYIQSNIVGHFRILEACRRYPVRHLVYASSSSVYGGNTKVPFAESDPVDRPMSLYAATKKADELMSYTYSSLYGIPATGLRFFTVYGPWGRPDMAVFLFTNSILKGKPIKVFNNGDLKRDFTYVDDIVRGVLRVAASPPKPDERQVAHKVYNIGNHSPVPLLDFISILEDELGKKAEKEFLPMQPGDVYQTYADVDALERDFGFKPETSLQKGLHAFVKWYKSYYSV